MQEILLLSRSIKLFVGLLVHPGQQLDLLHKNPQFVYGVMLLIGKLGKIKMIMETIFSMKIIILLIHLLLEFQSMGMML